MQKVKETTIKGTTRMVMTLGTVHFLVEMVMRIMMIMKNMTKNIMKIMITNQNQIRLVSLKTEIASVFYKNLIKIIKVRKVYLYHDYFSSRSPKPTGQLHWLFWNGLQMCTLPFVWKRVNYHWWRWHNWNQAIGRGRTPNKSCIRSS